MPKIILIATGTFNPGINNIHDIVNITEDNVELGLAYGTFLIVNVLGLIKSELNDILPIGEPSNRKNKFANNLPLSIAQINILEKMPGSKVEKKDLILSLVIHND
jgi:hypothetical protein